MYNENVQNYYMHSEFRIGKLTVDLRHVVVVSFVEVTTIHNSAILKQVN